MKRAVLCVSNPQDYMDQLDDYSVMIVNPDAPEARLQYLLDNSDWSLKITADDEQHRSGGDHGNERLFWYTSGTTGDSKFYGFTQTQLDAMATTICRAYDITANDRYVSVMPLWHAHGQGFYWATKQAGCEVNYVTMKNLRTMSSYSPTFITAVPDILQVIGQLDFDSLRFVRGASAPMSNKLYQDLKQHLGVPVIEAFGMTEALSHCFTNPLHGEQRMGTVGLPDGIEAQIQDGHLLIRGPTVFQPDWFDTGDLAQQDSAGYYRILGRHRDQINIKGYKINPASIEKQLQDTVDDLGHCVIFGDCSVNCIFTGTADVQTVIHALKNIHPCCKPTHISQQQTIPTTPGGKVSRSWLTKNFNGGC